MSLDGLPKDSDADTQSDVEPNETASADAASGEPSAEDAALTELARAVKTLRCGSIVVIDDNVPDIEAVRAQLTALPNAPEPIRALVEQRGGWPTQQEERWDVLEVVLDGLSFDERRKTTTAIYSALDNKQADWESAFAEPLIELRDSVTDLQVLSVSPREWGKHGPRYGENGEQVERIDSDIPIVGTPVFLFDYDLSTVPGRRSDEGLSLAKALLTSSGTHAAYCGVISQRFNNAPAAIAVRQSMTATDRDRLVLLSRNSMQDHAALAIQLQSVYRAHSAARLREIARDALAIAHERAMSELDALEVAPLLHVVVDRSYVEGISEFETLRRLYLLKFGRALDKAEAGGTELQSLMRDIRAIKLPNQEPPPALIDLEHEERYAEISFVNQRRLPVEMGDVFMIRTAPGGKEKRFVLVTHPCDLMVRTEGTRPTMGGQKETTYGVLLPMSPSELKQASYGFKLPFARAKVNDKRGSFYVRFRPPFYVPLFVLDLCVFSGSGAAEMERGASSPEFVPASVTALHARLQQRVEEIIASSHVHEPAHPDGQQVPLELRVPTGAVHEIAGRVDGDKLVYDCRREMRLSPAVAGRLLAEYSYFTSRDAAAMEMVKSD